MVMIPTVQDNAAPQGGIRSQASPNDFGAQLGGAEQNLAQGVSAAAGEMFRVEQDQGRIWAYDAASKAYTGLKQTLDQQVNSLDPNSPDFTEKAGRLTQDFTEQVDAQTQQLMEAAPSPSARKVLASHMAMNSRALLNQAMAEQSRVAGEYTAKMVNDGIKSDQDAIAADPSNENYDRITQSRQDSIGGLQTVDPVAKIKWTENMGHSLAVTQVGVLSATNPSGFLAIVHAQGGRTTLNGATRGAVPGGPDGKAAPAAAPPVQTLPSTPGGPPAPDADKAFNLIIDHESRGLQMDPKTGAPITNPASGATGAAQILPKYGPYAAELAGMTWDENRFKTDKAYNTTLGRAMFDFNLKEFDGDIAKAVAAYNVGPTGLRKIMAKAAAAGTPNDWLKFAPAETRAYVPAVMSKMGAQPSQVPIATSAMAAQDAPAPVPQVEALTEQDIAGATPAISGWGKLSWQEKVAAVRSAEAAIGGSLASERGTMERELKDYQGSVLAGKGYPGQDDTRFGKDNLVRLFGPDLGGRKFDQLSYTKQVGGFIGQMARMPAAQAAGLLKSLEPQGGAEFSAKQPVFGQAVEAFQRLQVMRNKDFAQWAVENQVAGAKPVDFSSVQGFQDSISARIPVANAGRTDYQADAHLLSNEEAGQLGTLVSRLNPQDQMGYIKALRVGTKNNDAWFNDALTQIAPKNTMLAYAAGASMRPGSVQTATGPQDGDKVGQYILEGAHILQGKDIDDPSHTGRPMALDENTFRAAFWDTVGAGAFSSPDAQRSSEMAANTYQAVKNYLAADIYHRGSDPRRIDTSSVRNAIKAVTGGVARVSSGDQLFLPWGMEEKAFHQSFPLAVSTALDRSGLKGGALDAPDAFHYSNVGEGRYLILTGGKPLQGRDGRPVFADIRNLIPSSIPGDSVTAGAAIVK